MTTYKKQFIFFITALCVQSHANPFSFGLSRGVVNVGERTTLEVRLEIPKDADESLAPEIDDSLLKQNPKLLLLQNDVRREEGQFVIRYDFTAYQIDQYTVPPISIKLGTNTYSTESLPLKVSTTREENDEALRPDSDAISVPVPWKKVFSFLFWTACILGVVAFIFRLLRKISWSKLTLPKYMGSKEPKINAKEWLKTEIKRIQKKTEENPNDSLVDEVTYVIKKYSFLTTQAPALSLTTNEMENTNVPAKECILEILKEYDFYKFSPNKSFQLKDVVLTATDKMTKKLCGT